MDKCKPKKIGEVSVTGRGGGKKHIKPYWGDISTYWARHSWATIAYELDIPKDIISQALGHSSGSDVTEYTLGGTNVRWTKPTGAYSIGCCIASVDKFSRAPYRKFTSSGHYERVYLPNPPGEYRLG